LILIKLGGSVLTDKAVPFSFDEKVTKRLSIEMKNFSDQIIVVHGGGSFGHPGAERYGLNTDKPREVPKATAEVRNDMRRMNQKIIDILIDEGIDAVSMPGGLVTRYSDGELISLDQKVFTDHLALGTTPVTFGDVALDEKRGVTICSGDDIMYGLAQLADMAVFVTNVDGIFKNGSLVEVFTEDMLPLTVNDIHSKKETIDVTGSMERKIELMLDMSEHCETYVVNGLKPGRLRSLIENKDTLCTRVER